MSREAGVPITLASDAHVPQRIGMWFEKTVALARASGYESVLAFDGRQVKAIPLRRHGDTAARRLHERRLAAVPST